jgi:transposase
MASLTAKKIHGRTYYYLRECRRVDGKPKIVHQVYLGSADEIAARLGKQPTSLEPLPRSPVFEFGAVAALLDLARRIELVEIIDRHVAKRGRGPSVGTYLLLAAVNRAVAPTSKAKFAEWYARTSLPRLLPVNAGQLTSQRFWDNMDRVGEEEIRRIERDLARKVTEEFDLDLSCVFYDATNFFTFIDSFNERPALPQRGKSKEGRSSLRILGLALLVTGDFQVPLFHHLYPGNQPDAPTFRSLVDELVRRYRLLTDGVEDVTLVFDKGNNAEDILESVAESPYHVVGSLVPTQHPDLLALPRKKLKRLDAGVFPGGVFCHRTEKEVFGRAFTVLVTYNEKLFVAQAKTIEREVAKRREKLRKYQRYLERWLKGKGKGKRPTIPLTAAAVKGILSGRHMKELFEVEIREDPRAGDLPLLTWRFDGRAYRRLQKTLLGKTLLFTDNSAWTDEQIVTAYRGQHHVESAFRQMKDPWHVSFRPAFHWTDQKLRVHALYCVLALLLCSLLRRELHGKGIPLSVNRILEILGTIREVQVLLTTGRGRPRTRRTHSATEPLAVELMNALNLDRFLAS